MVGQRPHDDPGKNLLRFTGRYQLGEWGLCAARGKFGDRGQKVFWRTFHLPGELAPVGVVNQFRRDDITQRLHRPSRLGAGHGDKRHRSDLVASGPAQGNGTLPPPG